MNFSTEVPGSYPREGGACSAVRPGLGTAEAAARLQEEDPQESRQELAPSAQHW